MHSFAALLMVSACAVAGWTEPEPVGTSRVKLFGLPPGGPNQIDLLIVVDDSAAMAPHRPRLAELAAAIDRAMDPRIDLRVAVTSNDGVLRGPTPFLAQRLDFNLVRTANFRGSLADTLVPRLDVGSATTNASQPLPAIRDVVERNPDGFVRDDAHLSILIITANDDASTETIDDVARWLRAVKQSRPPMVGVIRADATPKLDALAHRDAVAALDSDYGRVLEVMATQTAILLGICWELDDIDPVTPGDQITCAMSATINDRERLLRPCAGDTDPDPLCWRLVPSEPGCRRASTVQPQIAAYRFFTFSPALHLQCVSGHRSDVNRFDPFDGNVVNATPQRADDEPPPR